MCVICHGQQIYEVFEEIDAGYRMLDTGFCMQETSFIASSLTL
jgi:hypothetical protein